MSQQVVPHQLQSETEPAHLVRDLIPGTLPFHFNFDIGAGLLGPFGTYPCPLPMDDVLSALQKGWAQVRIRQEEDWVEAGCLPSLVAASFAAYGSQEKLHRFEEELASYKGDAAAVAFEQRRNRLKNCAQVLRLEMAPGREVKPEFLEDVSLYPHVFMVIDLSNDPFLDDCGYSGPKTFWTFLNIYDRYVSDASQTKYASNAPLEGPSRELRLARVASADCALLFRMLPYPRCKLAIPQPSDDFSKVFSEDMDVEGAGCLLQRLMEARASLGFLFWQVFDILFPASQPVKAMTSAGGKFNVLSNAPVRKSMSIHGRSSRTYQPGAQQSATFKSCSSREEALACLWRCTAPETFEMTFCEEVRAGSCQEAVQLAINQAAKKMKEAGAMLPPSWPASTSERKHWPLEVRPLDMCKLLNTTTEHLLEENTADADGLMPCAPLGNLTEDLAAYEFHAVLKVDSSDFEDGGNQEEDSKAVHVFVNLSRWKSEGILTVFSVNASDPWGADQMLGATRELEECVAARRSIDPTDKLVDVLEAKVSQLAYGFRALQRACVKQQLRDVGITVVEAERRELSKDSKGKDPLSLSVLARMELRAILRGSCRCFHSGGAPWLDGQLKKTVTDESQRVMLLSVPNGILESRAEQMGWIVKILPNRKTKAYPGNFVKEQFKRAGPTQSFWNETTTDPYPYHPYFMSHSPGIDPCSVLSSAERKLLVNRFLQDGRSDARFPDGTINPRHGGADLNPRELKAENIIDDFILLSDPALDEIMMREIVAPWRNDGWRWFFSRGLFRVDTTSILRTFGPQIASYFEFARFLIGATVPMAILGALTELLLVIGEGQAEFVRPIYGLCGPIWGMWVCSKWRSRCSLLACLWENGILQPGPEIADMKNRAVANDTVRPEFGHRFRKQLAALDADGRAEAFENLRQCLGVPEDWQSREAISNAFTDKSIEQDLELFNEACFIDSAARMTKNLKATLASAVFIVLASFTTLFSERLQDMLVEGNEQDDENESFLDYIHDPVIQSYIVSGLASGVIIPVLNHLYAGVAEWTTVIQEFEKDSEHQAALFTKLFVFQFFNSFNSLFWIAFIRQNFDQLKVQVLVLAASLAFSNIGMALTSGMVKQHLGRLRLLASGELALQKVGKGRLGLMFGYKLANPGGPHYSGAVERSLNMINHQMASKDNAQFSAIEERIEIAVQFSMLVMFSGVTPVLPLILLIRWLIEIRVDTYKLVRLQGFPEIHMLIGVGRTHTFLTLLAYFSLVVNTAICVLTRHAKSSMSTFDGVFSGYNLTDSWKLLMVLGVEHVVLAIMLSIQWSTPGSKTLSLELYRQKYFEHREARVYDEDEEDASDVQALRLSVRTKRTQLRLKTMSSLGGDAPVEE